MVLHHKCLIFQQKYFNTKEFYQASEQYLLLIYSHNDHKHLNLADFSNKKPAFMAGSASKLLVENSILS